MKDRAFTICALLTCVAISPSCASQTVKATEAATCKSASVDASILADSGHHVLTFTVNNPAERPMELSKFYFEANMLRLRAAKASDGKELSRVIPLLSPGVKNVVINPRSTFSQRIDLDAAFPDLSTALATTDVIISWELQLKPNGACFSQKLATSMTLRKSGQEASKP